MEKFTEDAAYSESMSYFDGDELAATTWINKYAMRDPSGNLLESNPQMMHDRMIDAILEKESKYDKVVLTRELLQELLYGFKYVIPGGSVMSGLGNPYKFTSLSNCFVIKPPVDSYGGILKADQELIQLCKRRGGVGTDLSHLRPAGSIVTNDAKTSSGLVSFMSRYSNSVREVAQNGRRGALMLTVSIAHPDAEAFIDAKTDLTKVTGANISCKITDEFMNAVKNSELFLQRFPVTATKNDLGISEDVDLKSEYKVGKLYNGQKPGTYFRVINATALWNKIIRNNTKFAEPGILFIDTIQKESPADIYKDKGFETVSTNPCGEIPLCPYDSCRLISINLYSFVENPWTKKAKFNFKELSVIAGYTQRIMDNIIDCEIDHINAIINKVKSDPEDPEYKVVELELWDKILRQTQLGRRTGVGITGIGDALASMNVIYGSKESLDIAEEMQRTIAVACYASSIQLAKERGAFDVWNASELEVDHPLLSRIYEQLPRKSQEDWTVYGRRNIACNTIAPAGTVSLMSQTTSGIEPEFRCWYIRRRKTNDTNKVTFIDKTGDMFEEFSVLRPGFLNWYIASINSKLSIRECREELSKLNDSQLTELYEKSPYYKSTAQDIDWVKKVELQGRMQKWIDHSISVTVNLPKGTTEDIVNNVYIAAYEAGCKGCTIYVDGSRDGVLVTKSATSKQNTLDKQRPKELEAKIFRFKNQGENWIAFIGLMNGNPYELFSGVVDQDLRYLPKSITEGKIIQVDLDEITESGKKRHRYDFQYKIDYGYVNTLPGISGMFRTDYWNYARFLSSMLRSGMPIVQIVNIIDGLKSESGEVINSWKAGVSRALRQFIKDGEKSGKYCEKCGGELIYQGGCKICSQCGDTKCE